MTTLINNLNIVVALLGIGAAFGVGFILGIRKGVTDERKDPEPVRPKFTAVEEERWDYRFRDKRGVRTNTQQNGLRAI